MSREKWIEVFTVMAMFLLAYFKTKDKDQK